MADTDQNIEREVKLALGSKMEFARWREALRTPQYRLNQINMYLRLADGELKLGRYLLRVRALCPDECQAEQCPLLTAAHDINGMTRFMSVCPLRRQLSKPFILTLKTAAKNVKNPLQAGYFQAQELEADITPDQAIRVLQGDLFSVANTQPGRFLRELDIESCAYQGAILNTRLCYPRPNGEVWELDLSQFSNGRCDAELEIETEEPERVMAEVSDLAQRAGLPSYTKQEKTKYERFVENLGENKKA